MTRSKASGVAASMSPRSGHTTPALLTSTSSPPPQSATASTSGSCASRSARSLVTESARPPAASMPARTGSSASAGRMSVHATSQPAAASSVAMAAPMPRRAPVTSATGRRPSEEMGVSAMCARQCSRVAAMCSPARSAWAATVSAGLTAADEGKNEASTT